MSARHPVIIEPHDYVNSEHCRSCRATYMREYNQRPEARVLHLKRMNKRYREQPEAWTDYDLCRKYGITLAERTEMERAQGGVCAICQRPERNQRQGVTKALAVDHDHATGQVRGLLCEDCNRGLGMFGDSTKTLLAAVAYLQGRCSRLSDERLADDG
jgi:hypothetical protein